MADMVNHPEHYTRGSVEVIDVIDGVVADIEDSSIGYSVGNAIKYLLRCPYKENMYRDLNKALWYINHAIELMGGENADDIEIEDEVELDIQTVFNDDITNVGFEMTQEEVKEVEIENEQI